jgi:hypothetical protein
MGTTPVPAPNKVIEVTVRAKPLGLWTCALATVAGVKRIIVSVVDENSRWQCASGPQLCGPGGTRQPGTGCLYPKAPLGALIGKLGGSDADDTTADNGQYAAGVYPVVFAVGSFWTTEIATDFKSALFLTMNDQVARFEMHDGSIGVKIETYS